MLELYNDNLIDLFLLVENHGNNNNNNSSNTNNGNTTIGDPPRLDIKKNEKTGMVFVQNITMKTCKDPHQTLKLFESANKKRQVGATKMNAESSRSHSIFSILVENYNKTTKTVRTFYLHISTNLQIYMSLSLSLNPCFSSHSIPLLFSFSFSIDNNW
jgi:hypothetical protein